MSENLIEFNGISKFFGKVIALKDVTMKVKKGEIMCLLGDNGAGKSTLIKTLSGVHKPDEGEIIVEGEKKIFDSPKDALDMGIATVYQDLALAPNLSGAANLFLGREKITKFGRVNNELMLRDTREVVTRINPKFRAIEEPVFRLSGGQQQSIAIARAIYFGAKILILDEPTSALGQKQQMEVLKTIKKVQELGNIAIILITHHEIHAQLIADRYTFLSLGEVIGSGLSEELGGDDIKRLMAGGAKLGDLESELAS